MAARRPPISTVAWSCGSGQGPESPTLPGSGEVAFGAGDHQVHEVGFGLRGLHVVAHQCEGRGRERVGVQVGDQRGQAGVFAFRHVLPSMWVNTAALTR